MKRKARAFLVFCILPSQLSTSRLNRRPLKGQGTRMKQNPDSVWYIDTRVCSNFAMELFVENHGNVGLANMQDSRRQCNTRLKPLGHAFAWPLTT